MRISNFNLTISIKLHICTIISMPYSKTIRTTLAYTASFENFTVSSKKSTSSFEATTTNDITTTSATQSKMTTTHFTMPPISFTFLSTRSTTQKSITSTTQISSSEMISSDSILSDEEITTDMSETVPIMTTTIPTTFSTLVTNGTTVEIPVDTSTIPPIVTSEVSANTITVKTDKTTITTIKNTMTDTTVFETTLTKKSSTISTPIPASKCTEANTTIYRTKYIALKFDYIVRNIETGIACILTNMMIQINLRYAMEDSQIRNATLMVPTIAKTTGICDENIAKMTLSWKELDGSQVDNNNEENNITFYYAHNETSFFLDFISVDVHLDDNNFPRAQKKRMRGDTANRHLQLFSAPINNGIFICEENTIINIGDQIDVDISNIRLIAFNNCTQNCSQTKANYMAGTNINIVAIVGAVLIVLILILILRICCSKRTKSEEPQNIANYFFSCGKVVFKK